MGRKQCLVDNGVPYGTLVSHLQASLGLGPADVGARWQISVIIPQGKTQTLPAQARFKDEQGLGTKVASFLGTRDEPRGEPRQNESK